MSRQHNRTVSLIEHLKIAPIAPNLADAHSKVLNWLWIAYVIKVDSLEFIMEGDVDLHGFLTLPGNDRPGLKHVKVKARVKADAPRERSRSFLSTLRSPHPSWTA